MSAEQEQSGQDQGRVWPTLAPKLQRPVVVVAMGVSGSGKTTIAALLAAAMHWEFREGDDLHPAANVEKMSRGIPLNDEDRWPWLRAIAEVIDGWCARRQSGVLTCSALKRSYRDVIVDQREGVVLLYLKGSRDLIARRMAARHEHFMPVALLDSQFATLEEPTEDEHPIVESIDGQPADIVRAVVEELAVREQERA